MSADLRADRPNLPRRVPLLKSRHSLGPRWTSPHLSLPRSVPQQTRGAVRRAVQAAAVPAPPRQPEQHSVDMSMQFLTYNSRVVIRPTVRIKIKRRLREAVNLIVTRGAAVEESRKGPKLVFRTEDDGAEKWIAPGVLLSHAPPIFCCSSVLMGRCRVCFVAHDVLHADWTYAASHHRDVPNAVCGTAWPDASSARVSPSAYSRG